MTASIAEYFGHPKRITADDFSRDVGRHLKSVSDNALVVDCGDELVIITEPEKNFDLANLLATVAIGALAHPDGQDVTEGKSRRRARTPRKRTGKGQKK